MLRKIKNKYLNTGLIIYNLGVSFPKVFKFDPILCFLLSRSEYVLLIGRK